MNEERRFVSDWVEERADAFFGYAKSVWEYAELGCSEFRSSKLMVEVLRENGFEVREGVAGMPTAFVAVWGSGNPAIAFSCEYDALPGLSPDAAESTGPAGPGHGCGHNLLGVGSVMAAIAAGEWLKLKGIPGKLVVFGTPAEELCIGKPFMAREGLFDGMDAILDWHPWIRNSADYDTCNAYFNIKYHFHGRNAHGNSPWMGRSALDGAVLMGHAIEMLREHIPPGNPGAANTINYTFSDVGPCYPSVVPDHSTLWAVGRITESETMEGIMARVHRCAEGASIATGTSWEMEFKTASHEKIPNRALSTVLYRNFLEIGGPDFTREDQDLARAIQKRMNVPQTGLDNSIPPLREGASILTDNSEYSWFAPFAMIWVATAPEGFGWHNREIAECTRSSIGRKAMTTAAKVLAASCVELFRKPELLSEAKRELAERLAGRTYKSLIPDETPVPVAINT